MTIPTPAQIDERLSREDLDTWLDLWAVEQGPAKRLALDLMASVVPAPALGGGVRVLDLCCGPGDVGRAIHARFPTARVDAVDRDSFLTRLCAAANTRAGVDGQVLRRDLYDAVWSEGLVGPYDVVAVGNALHWLRLARVREILADVLGLLAPRGLLLFLEPACAMAPVAEGFAAWRTRRPPQHDFKDWIAFWTRINEILGYDHIAAMGRPDPARIGDAFTAADWLDLTRQAGFAPADILMRDAEKVVVVAARPEASQP